MQNTPPHHGLHRSLVAHTLLVFAIRYPRAKREIQKSQKLEA